ncbi:TPR repeat-containing protein (fragment) [Candidatus Sulfopaludibacter sp. SbA3]
MTFHQAGRDRESVEALRHAVRLQPAVAELWCDLGIMLAHLEAWDEAEDAYRRAVQVRSDFPEALNNLGNLLRRRGCVSEAIPCYQSALRHRADFVEAHYNLGLALQSFDHLEEAQSCYATVLGLNPRLAAAQNNLANTLQSLGAVSQAMPYYHRAVELAGANTDFRVNLGMAQLLLGQFGEGWRNYSARGADRVPGVALWDGSPLQGRRILLRAEQGFGDTIQFIRYGGMLKQRGGFVLLSCPPALTRLLATAQGIDHLLPEDRELPACDFWAPLLHLPGILQTRLETIPAHTPYLSVDPELARQWVESLRLPASHLKVGIAWRGSPAHHNDGNRSIAPAELAALAEVPDTSFVSLQPGCPGGCPESRLPFVPLGRELTDFADTAALVIGLDLVISVDTSVAHLAGALARPVWTLLPFAPDWRWMRERADSPWYPTMKLFRQSRRKDWPGVLARLREELSALARTSRSEPRR